MQMIQRRGVAPYGSGKYYYPEGRALTTANIAAAAGTIRFTPGRIRKAVTINALLATITTAAAGGLFQVSVYASDPANGNPTGAPLVTIGSQSTTATGVIETATSLTLQPGPYWWAVQVDTTGAATAFLGLSGPWSFQSDAGSATANGLGSAAPISAMSKTGTFGTWPTLTGNLTTDSITQGSSGNAAIIGFKVA